MTIRVLAQGSESPRSTPGPPPDAVGAQVNIWDEPDLEEYLKYDLDKINPIVSSGTLNKLVEKLTDEKGEGSIHYLDYVKTFLLTYGSFTSNSILLRKLIERYHVPRKRAPTFADFDRLRLTVQLRVCNVLIQWIRKFRVSFQQDGAEDQLTSEIWRFVEEVLAEDHPTMAKQIRRCLHKLDPTGKEELKSLLVPPPSKLPSEKDKLNIFVYPEEEIARQLTIIEFNWFSAIKPIEFLNQAWAKSDATVRASNIIALTRRFNAIASWAATSILEPGTPRHRAKRMAKLIEVSNHLLVQNNFSSLMALIAGMNKSSVTRLKHTFKELPAKSLKRLKELETIMTAEGSYKNYRALIHSINPPCIPYIGVYLLDLTFMEDGNPNLIPNTPRINFSKRSLIANVIREIQQYQSTPFNLKVVEDLNLLLSNFPDHTEQKEKSLYSLSLQREPRESPSKPS